MQNNKQKKKVTKLILTDYFEPVSFLKTLEYGEYVHRILGWIFLARK